MDAVRAIADTVLYEGHLLWPYRVSAQPDRQRWTIGGIHPKDEAERSGGRWTAFTEFLMEMPADDPETAPGGLETAVGAPGTAGEVTEAASGVPAGAAVEFRLRFLHSLHRQVMDGDAPVNELWAAGGTYRTRREAREREITSGRVRVARLLRSPVRVPVAIAAGLDEEPIEGPARIVRTWERVTGTVVLSAERAGPGAVRLRAAVVNTGTTGALDDEAGAAMLSAHLVAEASGGAFVSPADPPGRLAVASAACRSDGLWPVLAGAPGSRHTMLAAPVVLYDWPQVAPQTPADLFGGAGLDRLLAALSSGEPRGGDRAPTGTGGS
jgi:hypothetical protein